MQLEHLKNSLLILPLQKVGLWGEQIPLSFTCVHKASGNSCNAGLPVESAAIFSKPRFVLFQWDSVYLRVSFDQGGLRRFMATHVADLQAWKIQF